MYGFTSVKFQKFGIGVDVGNGACEEATAVLGVQPGG